MASVLLYRCVFLLSSLLSIATCQDFRRQLDFRSALAFEGSRLINHVISTINFVEEDFCGALCFMEHNCVSINMEITSGSTTATICELNNSTHLEHPDDLKPRNNYIYRGIKNPCGKSPCQNHATCQAGFTNKGYRCLCVSGFIGHDCETDVDECLTGQVDCDVNTVCTNTKGSYNCICKEGYYGDGRNCTDIDECARGDHGCDADSKSVCKNTAGSYTCRCIAGFARNGADCEDVDECDSNLGPCHANAKCENTIGSHKCSCKPGFTQDGYSCQDVDECNRNPGPCHTNAKCENTIGSHKCSCKPGFTGDAYSCQDIDECTPGSHDCLPRLAFCTNTVGSYSCSCYPGYVGDGKKSCRPEEKYDYTVTVYTGDEPGAGTDAKVFVEIFGEIQDSGEVELAIVGTNNPFEQGRVDTFNVILPNLGRLTKLTVRHDNEGDYPAWFLSKILVRNTKEGVDVLFVCSISCWIKDPPYKKTLFPS